MATLMNKWQLAALNKENCEEHPRSNLAQISNFLRSQEDYITQVSEETEGRVTKKLSKDLSRTDSHILGALSQLNEFLLNSLIQGHSGTAPKTSRNALGTIQGTIEDDSQSDPHPEASVSQIQTTRNSGPDDGYDSAGSPEQTVEEWVCNLFSKLLNKTQLVVLSRFKSNFKDDTSGKPQVTVPGHVVVITCITSDVVILPFADDPKLYWRLTNETDRSKLQTYLV